MAAVPSFVIEYFLLGRTRRDALQRFTQDGGIVSDVWLAFAEDQEKPQRVLVAPSSTASSTVVGYALHEGIRTYRTNNQIANRVKPTVSPLENFVAVTLYFDELLRIVLPLTTWWRRKNLSLLRLNAKKSGRMLDQMLERAIRVKLGVEEIDQEEISMRKELAGSEDGLSERRVLEAASLAALIGVFQAAQQDSAFFTGLPANAPRTEKEEDQFVAWVSSHARKIADAARAEFARQFEASVKPIKEYMEKAQCPQQDLATEEAPELIQRVFLDRKASLADFEAICTIKADAANRVFDISCRSITWAIIDSGIASAHPAFIDHNARVLRGQAPAVKPSRVKATYDFTAIQRIRNFDLIADRDGTAAREAEISSVVDELQILPGRPVAANFRAQATERLRLIARQLDDQLLPDWNLIEPLIRIDGTDDGAQLVSDHGTHVAGILGADWRQEANLRPGSAPPAAAPVPGAAVMPPAVPRPAFEPPARMATEVLMKGVCPDINLYDLRVLHRDSRQRTEFALLAALEFTQFVNARAGSNGPLIHGVNISMSIPHDVRNYGCGSTPVCVACDRLTSSGVIVVAAAGNRGWNEQEMGFGNFVFCSITDPGNAQEVITVGSTHRLKPHMFGVSYFSSRGPTGDGRIKPDLVAPGEQIRGPLRGDSDDELDGTSMAAPFVSGAAAMLLARHRELVGNPARIKRILCDTATDLGRERYFQGHGLVDVLRALQSV